MFSHTTYYSILVGVLLGFFFYFISYWFSGSMIISLIAGLIVIGLSFMILPKKNKKEEEL